MKFPPDVLQKYRESAFRYRERRHPHWTENYDLYRDTVITNRLTQRQSVNVPLTKETIKTILTGISDAPDLVFENKDNDKQKELFFNEYWKDTYSYNKIEILDVIDKKQVLLYGRSFIKHNIKDGRYYAEVLDPMDVLVDRYVDPRDIESANFIVHTGIFKTLDEIKANKNYDEAAVKDLETYFGTEAGLIKAEGNTRNLAERNQRLADMGVQDVNSPVLGKTYVELNEFQVKEWNADTNGYDVWVVVLAESNVLMEKLMKDVLGINSFSITTWADDIERTDFWSDGWADVTRVPNQIANVFLSQEIEARTLANFGMQFYNSDVKEGWTPQGYTPAPFGFYPIPAGPDGDINKVLKRIEINPLDSNMQVIEWVVGLAEKATAATSIEKGEEPDKQITLGEVQLLASKANQRIGSIKKFYRQAWLDFGNKFVEIVEANYSELSEVKLYKKSPAGNYYGKIIKPSDWKSKSGYEVQVVSAQEKEQDAIQTLQKFQVLDTIFPGNQALADVKKKKALDWAGINPEQQTQIMDEDKQMRQTPPEPGIDLTETPPNSVDVALQSQGKALATLTNG